MKEIMKIAKSSSSEILTSYSSKPLLPKKPSFKCNKKVHDGTLDASTSQQQSQPQYESEPCDDNDSEIHVWHFYVVFARKTTVTLVVVTSNKSQSKMKNSNQSLNKKGFNLKASILEVFSR